MSSVTSRGPLGAEGVSRGSETVVSTPPVTCRFWFEKPLKTPLPWDDEVTTEEEDLA